MNATPAAATGLPCASQGHEGYLPAVLSSAPLLLPDEAATVRLGAALAGIAGAGDVICFRGPLGAGKTTAIRGLIQALQSSHGGGEPVISPTFTLVQTYEAGALTIWHFDLYRIERPEELVELAFEDALEEGLTLIEWPEILGAWTPEERLDISLHDRAGGGREARLAGFGAWETRLAELRRALAAGRRPGASS